MAALESQSAELAPAGRLKTLAACSVGSFFGLSTLIIYPFGVFALSIAQNFNWPRRDVAGMMGAALLITIVLQPVTGWVVNRFPKRATALTAMAGLALGTLLLALAPGVRWLFPWLIAGSIILGSLAAPTIYSAILAKAFDRRRGLALGFATAFSGVGIALVPIFCSHVNEAYGWRAGYGVLTVLAALAFILNAWLLPKSLDDAPIAPPQPAAKLSMAVAQAFRLPRFWKMAVIFLLLSVAANGVPLHLPIILKERGASSDLAALSLTVTGGAMVISRPLLGYLLDRLPVRLIVCAMLLGPLIGSLALILTTGPMAACAAAFGYGLAIGGEFVCLGYMVSRGFEISYFGAIYGWLAVALAGGVSGGPIGISLLLRLGHGYGPPLIMVACVSLLAIGATLTLSDADFRRPREA